MAAVVHGSSIVTEDVDVCIRFDLDTLHCLFRALAGTNPRLRMSPARPPLGEKPEAYVGFKNLYLVTDEGTLDLLGQVTAVGGYEVLAPHALELDLGGFTARVMSVEHLIASKRALGRQKDLQVVEQLERVVRQRDSSDD